MYLVIQVPSNLSLMFWINIMEIEEKQRERYELALEKYNTLVNMYPESKYIPELEPTIKIIQEELSNIKTK